MTRTEYLESQGKPGNKPVVEHEHPVFISLDEYLAARRRCEQYEQAVKITEHLTKEDYESFDRNFEYALNDLLYKEDEPGFDKDEIERTVEMMKAVNWIWANKDNKPGVPTHDEIIDLIKYCYEHCLESGCARGGCATGGVSVETDIMDHMVTIKFCTMDAYAFDGDDAH